MVAYELIVKLEKTDLFAQLLKAGIVPVNWLDYKVIYEFYLRESKVSKGKQLITNVAEEFGISDRKVYLVVEKMKG